ncbi:MAG TPA: SdrD B-like domain-containing protein [Tepidisphaeraceae bacterium]|nr:SdrD B-like domain-containing protein [Tepidisphaeraceae bacterium]
MKWCLEGRRRYAPRKTSAKSQPAVEQLEIRRLLSVVYSVVDLGTLGGSSSMATSINNAGLIVGQADTSSGASHPFLYNPSTASMQDLGTFGGATGSATGINSAGQVVGWATASDNIPRPFLWSSSGLTNLTPAGASGGQANGINDGGAIAMTLTLADGSNDAYLDLGGQYTNLNSFLGSTNSLGQAINVSNQVAGNASSASLPNDWFMGNSAGASVLGAPANSDGALSFNVTSINDAGQTVGYRVDPSPDPTEPNLPSGWIYSGGQFGATAMQQPQYMDNAGDIVGASFVNGGADDLEAHAFVTEGGVTQDLNNLIATGSGTGWVLSQANSMNSAGQIVGWGLLNGAQHAFLLNPQVSSGPPAATGQITGTVFEDSNGNGQVESGEPSLSGWQVYIDANDNGILDPGEQVATADSFGHYALSGLAAGTYVVREVQPGGWASTVPAPVPGQGAFYDVTLASNTSIVSDENFGNVPIHVSTGSGQIVGSVYNDANGNAKRQKNEKPLASVQVFVDLNNDGLFESGEPTATTDASGHYVINGLGAGTYNVDVTAPTGWVVTTSASGSLQAQLASSTSVVNEPDIGLDLGATVSGQLLNDATGKGRINRKSLPLAGWRVFIDDNGDGTWQPNEPSVVTNSAGQFTLTGLRPGNFLLRVVPETGWQQTKPTHNAPLRIHLVWKKKLKTPPFAEHEQ